jgi:hypothetical protein
MPEAGTFKIAHLDALRRRCDAQPFGTALCPAYADGNGGNDAGAG